MQWVTRSNVRVGRIACSWLIRTCIDREAEILYLPADQVDDHVKKGAIAFHVRGGEFNHIAGKTPFELILEKYDLRQDPALDLLGRIVNGADTDNRLYNQPEGPGVRAVTEGIRAMYPGNDEAIIELGSRVFDALYAYCRQHTEN